MSIAGWGFGARQKTTRDPGPTGEMWRHGRVRRRLLWIDGVKLMPDGGVGDRTARMYDGYVDEPRIVAQWTVPPDDLVRHIRWSHENGFAMDIHTCGDEAQEVLCQRFAGRRKANPKPRLRHRVHHAYLPTARTLTDGGTPDRGRRFRIRFCGRSARVTGIARRGPAGRMMPMRTYLNRGVPLAGSSDSPVATHNPWIGFAAR